MTYREMLLQAFSDVSSVGRSRAATIEPPVEKPRCPDHPDSCVCWSNLREAYRCVTCRKVLGNPDPDFVGVNEVL